MKIIEVMGSRSTKYGGVEIFMKHLVEQDKNNMYYLIYNEYPRCKEYVDDLKSLNVQIHVVDVRGFGYVRNYFKFRKLLKTIRPDIVHFHFSSAHCFWAPLSKRLGVKRIFKSMHGCLYYKGLQAQNLSDLSLRHRLITQWGDIFKIYERVFCVSHFVLDQHKRVYGDHHNSEVVYMGTDNPKLITPEEKALLKNTLGVLDSQRVLLSIMFANPIKGCDILIKALPLVKGNYKLLIVGMDEEANYTKQMHDLAKSLNVESNIVWVGITNSVYKYMNISDIYIQPSRTDALSLAAVEAMSHALPVVATETGGLPEVASSLFNYEDNEELAEKISKLLFNSDEYKSQSAKSYNDWCDHFSLESGVKRYKECYNR